MARLRLVAAAIVVVLLAGGLWAWDQIRFPARTEALAGTPIELRVQDGIPAGELALLRDGLRAGDRYLDRRLGGGLRERVEARLARRDGCEPFQDPGAGATGVAKAGFLCVDTSSPGWRDAARRDRGLARTIPAHEQVHAWQAERGCLPGPDEHELLWFVEGMAVFASFRAVTGAGLAPRRSEARWRRAFERGEGPVTEPLATFERQGGGDRQYAMWAEAVERLVALAPGGERALGRYCERIGGGASFRAAFRPAFGLSLEDFYARFERGRPRR